MERGLLETGREIKNTSGGVGTDPALSARRGVTMPESC